MEDGSDFNGRQTLALARNDRSPFRKDWDVMLLVKEIEQSLDTRMVDLPFVYNGSNNYVSLYRNVVASTFSSLIDPTSLLVWPVATFNMPDYDGFPIEVQVPEVKFEAATYGLLRLEPGILASRLLCHRVPIRRDGPRLQHPQDILGRRLLAFERAQGENYVWNNLDRAQQAGLLAQCARMRAALFNFQLLLEFASTWLRERLFEQKPTSLPVPVAPTREFCVALFTAKLEATIRNIGDMIGWESDDNTVGPIAAAAKQSLLRLVPHVMPSGSDEAQLHRLVLEHGDFGIHNMSTTMDANNQPLVTSLYDWETGCIAPAILSDPSMKVIVDLVADENATPATARLWDGATQDDLEHHAAWATQYFQVE